MLVVVVVLLVLLLVMMQLLLVMMQLLLMTVEVLRSFEVVVVLRSFEAVMVLRSFEVVVVVLRSFEVVVVLRSFEVVEVLFSPLPVVHVYAISVGDSKMADSRRTVATYSCPVYKKPRRTDLNYIFFVSLRTNQSAEHWTLRGTALLCDCK
uniref:Dynein heavy chain C-terminal domain-containing protein n=1 Tax=Knipowitschia caucasica TaxID=637954 RepID=A0AAV2L6B0_KNICA